MKLFYGWVIVGVGMLVTCVGLGSMMSLGVFLKPIAADVGWSRSEISLASMLTFLCMGAGSFAWGALTDRFGTRPVVLGGGALAGLGLIGASQATSLLQFQFCLGALLGTGVGAFYAPMMATTSTWFERHRSLAVGLVSAGSGFGAMFIGPLAGWIIAGHGWRTAMLVQGAIALALIVPSAFLLRRPALAPAGRAARDVGEGGEFTVAQAFRTPQFAALAFTHFACCAAHSGPIFHMVSYAIDCGVPDLTAAGVIGAAGFAALVGRISCGLLADRIGAKPMIVFCLALQALSVGSYLFIREAMSFYALALAFGYAYGGVMPLYAILVREYFGARIMGSVFGAVAAISTLGMAIGPWAGGWLFDLFVSYFWLYLGSFGIGFGAVAVALTFRPPQAVPLLTPSLAR